MKIDPSKHIFGPESGEVIAMAPPTGGTITILGNPKSHAETKLCTLIQTLDPGALVPPHRHERAEQVLYFASGSGRVTIGDHTANVDPGTTVHVPRGVAHSILNTGGQPLSFVETTSPPGFEEAFRELAKLSAPTPDGVAAVLAQHDINLVDQEGENER